MKKNDIIGIDFIEPNIRIDWNMKEDDLINLLQCNKNDSRIYVFENKISSEKIDVFNRISFFDSGYQLEIIVSKTKQEIDKKAKTLYIDTKNNNLLQNYVEEKFGKPKFFSKLFSIINKPFYIYRWKFDKFKLSHKYHDSVTGFYERLLFKVTY
ncbi:hypothetical protein RJI07_05970 [Mycoplasmatota bacterium WC30]